MVMLIARGSSLGPFRSRFRSNPTGRSLVRRILVPLTPKRRLTLRGSQIDEADFGDFPGNWHSRRSRKPRHNAGTSTVRAAIDRYNPRMNDLITIHTDGGARGNPGPAAFAYVLERPGQDDIEEKGLLGVSTNNIAEYTALVKALEHAKNLGGRRVLVHSDSELMVKQMNGDYKVKNENLLPLYEAARKLVRAFDDVEIRHIYRDKNKRADRLYNEALDDPASCTILDLEPGIRKPPPPKPAAKPVPRPAPAATDAATPQALAILRDALRAWADGDDDPPTPQQIWDRLRKLMRGADGP
jgi:ribonuclease HI